MLSFLNLFKANDSSLVVANVLGIVTCLSWFGNRYLFGIVIGFVILAILLYILFLFLSAFKDNFNDLKNHNIGTIVYKYLLIKVPCLISIFITFFALWLIFNSDAKISLYYLGGSFICFFEIVVLSVIMIKMKEYSGRVINIHFS